MLLLKHGKIGHATRNRDKLLLREGKVWKISKLKRSPALIFFISETFRTFTKHFAYPILLKVKR